MAPTGRQVWRDFVTDGVPSSGLHKPSKKDAREWAYWLESLLAAVTAAGGKLYTSRAAMNADLTPAVDTPALVIGDPVVANNGLYVKVGAAGSGSWSRVGDVPGYQFVRAENVGAGTPNAIVATSALPISGDTLVYLPVSATNTASPVTVSFNGGAPLTVKTNGGNDVVVSGLVAGMVLLGNVSGATFRLISDQASAAVLAAAEDAADRAEAAANYNAIYLNVAQFVASDIHGSVAFIRTAGYYIPGDGGGAMYTRLSAAPSPAQAWHKQSADGAWWMLTGPLSSRSFGSKPNMPVFDSAPAINAALRYSAETGNPVTEGQYRLYQGSPITVPDRAVWLGSNYETYIVKMPTYVGPALRTEFFEILKSTANAFAANVPETMRVDYFTFDGAYQNAARSAYGEVSGEGLQFFARKIGVKARVFNMQGVGAWIECPGGNGPAPLQPGFSREADISLYTHQTQYEGVVWKGPPDVKLDWILQADAGSRIVADQLNGKVFSPNYGNVNGGKTDGVVFDGKGAELGAMHCFGNFGGGGFDWRNGGRINADLVMVESCHFGGASISGAAQGMISKFDIHRTGGFSGDATADFIYKGTGGNNYGLEIGTLASYRQDAANLGARNNVEIAGSFLDIGNVKIDNGSTATAGHGILIDMDNAAWITIGGGEIARCKGVAPDGLASSAVYRKGAGTGNLLSIKANVRDCDVAFRSDGAPYVEDIDLQYYLNAGQTPFVGTVRTHITQEWNIRGRLGNTRKVSHFEGLSDAFDPTLTTKQTLTIPHNLIHAPGFGRYQATGILDTPSSMTTGRIGFIQVIGADDTNITVEVQMATANGSNTAPRVTVFAEL